MMITMAALEGSAVVPQRSSLRQAMYALSGIADLYMTGPGEGCSQSFLKVCTHSLQPCLDHRQL